MGKFPTKKCAKPGAPMSGFSGDCKKNPTACPQKQTARKNREHSSVTYLVHVRTVPVCRPLHPEEQSVDLGAGHLSMGIGGKTYVAGVATGGGGEWTTARQRTTGHGDNQRHKLATFRTDGNQAQSSTPTQADQMAHTACRARRKNLRHKTKKQTKKRTNEQHRHRRYHEMSP